jgi:hypothetical protein
MKNWGGNTVTVDVPYCCTLGTVDIHIYDFKEVFFLILLGTKSGEGVYFRIF